MTTSEQILLLFAIYGFLFIAVLIWSVVDRKRDQRKADLARVENLCRLWKSMDQPRDERGRFRAKERV